MADKKIPVSVIVLTKNEEVQIGSTLDALSSFHEIIVVDSVSSDRTTQIALEKGAKVVEFIWNGQYPKKKQWALENAGAEATWVLLLDADETPDEDLTAAIDRVTRSAEPTVAAYDIPLLYRFSGKLLHHGHRVYKRSLLRREACRFPDVHDQDLPGIREVEGHYQPECLGEIRRLDGMLIHDDRDPVSSWFERHNRYSDWEAHLNTQKDLKRTVASKRSNQGRIFDRAPFKPLVFFIYAFVLRRGFLDGRAGFDYAFALSSYYWQIGLKTRELSSRKVQQETLYGSGRGGDGQRS